MEVWVLSRICRTRGWVVRRCSPPWAPRIPAYSCWYAGNAGLWLLFIGSISQGLQGATLKDEVISLSGKKSSLAQHSSTSYCVAPVGRGRKGSWHKQQSSWSFCAIKASVSDSEASGLLPPPMKDNRLTSEPVSRIKFPDLTIILTF